MSKLSCDVFLSIAKTHDTWYVLIMGDALSDGLISSSYIQKFKKAAKKFKIESCKMRVLLADNQLDVKMSSKDVFTIDEVENYINMWKLKSHAKKFDLTCECGDEDCDGTECDLPKGHVRSMVFGEQSQQRKEVRPFVAEHPPNA